MNVKSQVLEMFDRVLDTLTPSPISGGDHERKHLLAILRAEVESISLEYVDLRKLSESELEATIVTWEQQVEYLNDRIMDAEAEIRSRPQLSQPSREDDDCDAASTRLASLASEY